MKKKKLPIGFIIGFIVTLFIMLALLELSKNTIPGFIVMIGISCIYCYVYLSRYKDKKALSRWLLYLFWLVTFGIVYFVTQPPTRAVPAVDYKNPVKTDTVQVANGLVQGVVTEDGAVEIYAGIPYAKPPVGDLRWKEPQDPDNWDGVLIADKFAPMGMQPVNSPLYNSLAQIIGYHDYKISLKDNYVPPVSEDSLYINIWKPAGKAENLPVVVYVHGGSLQTGQPWYEDYSGQGLAREGVIVVNMGYRLGVFGYFASPELAAESANATTGNYGLLDQIKALEWVQDNIAAFGGNPDNVTLAGESAGSASVSAICVSPLAKGLFKRAVMESSTVAPVSPTHSFRLLDEAFESGADLMKRYNCSTIADLRKVDAKTLVKEADTQHHMTVDGYALAKTPYEYYMAGEYNEEAVIHGYNRHEADAFLIFSNASMKNYESRVRDYFGEYTDEALALYPASTDDEAKAYWSEIWGAIFFDYPHYCLNRLEVKNGVPTYQYYFTKDNGRLGPWHSGEEVYLYGNIPADSKLYDAYDRELSKNMLSYFANFAKTGDPNGAGLKEWELNTASEDVMEFGDNYGMIKEREHALFAILDKMQEFTTE
ncbi:MAG: carboxylesterase family protein [Lachnospiraceae bacterium]|nr:carboxylesterase family protein [Lachnospiraceae bacterium]